MKNSQRVKKITVIALFCALSFIVSMIFPIKVSFLTLDLKDAVSAICGMFFGPAAGLACATIVPFIEFTYSDTGVYGLIMNLLSSISLVGISSLIYKYKHSIVGAVLALACGAVATVAAMSVANLYITPYYMGVSREQVAELLPKLIMPFNLVKATLNCSLTMLLYKPISRLLKKMGVSGSKTTIQQETSQQGISHQETSQQEISHRGASHQDNIPPKGKNPSLTVAILSALILIASLVVIFFVLGGSFN